MSNVSKIKIGSTSYDVADKTARDRISALSDNMNNMETTLLDVIDSVSDEIPTVAKGSGTLTNVSDVSIRYSGYSYQRVDKFITLEVNTYVNPDRSIGELTFSVPSFLQPKNQNFGICISSIGTLCKWEMNGSSLYIRRVESGQWVHETGEEFRFVITYEV